MASNYFNLTTLKNLYKNVPSLYNDTNIILSNHSYLVLTGKLYNFISSLENIHCDEPYAVPKECSYKIISQNIEDKKYTLDKLIKYIEISESSTLIKEKAQFVREKTTLLLWLNSMSIIPESISVVVFKSINIAETNSTIVNTIYEPHSRHIFHDEEFLIELDNLGLTCYKKINNLLYEVVSNFRFEFTIDDENYIVHYNNTVYEFFKESEFYKFLASMCLMFIKEIPVKKCKLIVLLNCFNNIYKYVDYFKNISIVRLSENEQINIRGNSILRLFRQIIDIKSEHIKLCHIHTTPYDTQIYYNNIYNYPSSFCDYAMRKDFIFKYEIPEIGLNSIVGIPSLEETNIFASNARPAMISEEATKAYGVNDIMEMKGRTVYIVKRNKLKDGEYEVPFRYVFRPAKITNINSIFRFDMACVDVEYIEDKSVSTNIRIQRACIYDK